jgi:hypothetical protein
MKICGMSAGTPPKLREHVLAWIPFEADITDAMPHVLSELGEEL